MIVTTTLRPRFAGMNIRTWIGFRQLMALAEEAVLSWLREHGLGARELYHARGVALEMIDSSVQLPALVEIDDEVIAEVTETRPGRFSVRLRNGERTLLHGKIEVALVQERDAVDVPDEWRSFVVRDVAALATNVDPIDPPRDAFTWAWPARYFHCNYSDRVQHGSYVAALEEVVDRFLAHRGLGIKRMLRERAWIPVVSRARVRSLAAAHMDEVIHTTFAVDDVMKMTAFSGRMDCHVERGGARVHVATARILHGYAISEGIDAGKLATLDEETVAALVAEGEAVR